MAQFSGDWGDSFGPGLTDELTKLHTKEVGAEVVNGIHTKVIEVDNPQAGLPNYKMWLDTSYGEAVKLAGPMRPERWRRSPRSRASRLESRRPRCSRCPRRGRKPAAQPPPPTEAKQVAALTRRAGRQVHQVGERGPGLEGVLRGAVPLVKPKTLAPVTTPFRVGVDAAGIYLEHPPHYITGGTGKPYFQGGGLHEVTKDYKNGVLRIESAPPVFYLELSWDVHGAAGRSPEGAAAPPMLYRQCNGKSAARLLLVADPEKPGEPSAWVWEK